MFIDFHTHTFPDKICESTIRMLADTAGIVPDADGSVNGLLKSMHKCSVDYSVNLPVMTNIPQVEKVNASFIRKKDALFEQGIIAFGGMHPDYDKPGKMLTELKEAGIKGIKLHPAYQGVDLDDLRMMRIIDIASELGLVTITHAGIDIGLYDHNYASVKQILHVIDTLHPESFVLAHMGGWACWDDVERDLCGADVWFDTAFSIGEIHRQEHSPVKPYIERNMTVEDFGRIARKHGTDRILFGTDSPWASPAEMADLICQAVPDKKEQSLIFHENAERLLHL